ncbi:uncharacterized protein LOC9658494 isoform X2 [Selaginella moellendorffii]|uniref:uncharacterized protein LOC9658494 isoform X2 n=1 Tax=Selaginella moellendorffii TaxID=88036 RepID=UPI000D1CE414|nr:uncharacterized protein LOC9658494 isoform X2 [Selaginella moellendorffii]|eukprot:XP_024525564.1 uncharacterized protein LOC9658494 isoform X2 [Selaginella moellendorffii]
MAGAGEQRHGFKKARPASSSIDRRADSDSDQGDEDRRKHSKFWMRKWLDCPLDQGLKDALRRDLEEICEENVDPDVISDVEDEWVDCDETVFGSQLVKNPFEDLDVEEISTSLPNANYVKACMVYVTDETLKFEEDRN